MLDKAQRLLQPSARSAVPPFMVMDVMAAAVRLEAQGRRIIHMEVGQPAVGAPASAIAAARAALSAGPLGYTEALGIASLRRRIALDYGERHGLDIDPARIVVTTGSSAGFILAFLAAFEAGDRVAMALPGYPPYRHILTALGCEPVWIETNAQTRWSITSESLLALHRARPLKGVIVVQIGALIIGVPVRIEIVVPACEPLVVRPSFPRFLAIELRVVVGIGAFENLLAAAEDCKAVPHLRILPGGHVFI
jgi:hypothetical protein